MKVHEKVLLVYGAALAGSAVYHYTKGARGSALLADAATTALLVGTGGNVVLWLHNQSVTSKSQDSFLVPSADSLTNPQSPVDSGDHSVTDLGKTPSKAISLLQHINPEVLFRAADAVGVRISPKTYDNPAAVGMF
jgi:hypothetical protein